MRPKRIKRRAKREAEFGPERRVVNLTLDHAVLECGHLIVDPPRYSATSVPKHYCCKQCR